MRIIDFKKANGLHVGLKDNVSYVLGEDEPVCRTIQVDNKRFFISLPYITYMLQERFLLVKDGAKIQKNREFYISFSQTSTTELATALRCTGLPNVEADGEVCLGADINMFEGELNTATFKKVVSHFWMSQFIQEEDGDEWHGVQILRQHFRLTKDFTGFDMTNLHKRLGAYQAWADVSKKDSSYGLKIEWPKLDIGDGYSRAFHGNLRDVWWEDLCE